MSYTRQISAVDDPNMDNLDDFPQPVVSFGQDLAKGQVLPFHSHRRAQLVYASQGVMAVNTRSASYVIPPQRAVWMPSGIEHRIEARNVVNMRTLYIALSETGGLPRDVCVLQITPLLRELIVEAVSAGIDYEPCSPLAKIMSVILDQICTQPVVKSLKLPLPTDPRLLRVVQALIDNPADPRELADWANEVGASTRTLVRLFPVQTGMTFREWRQQRRLLCALELLAAGVSVTNIALEIGYENTSAFIAMFRRSLGTTPTRYLP
jgi:AraC-like DNA-binding protein